jgi:membrane protein required for beta-lactamase induction
LRHTCVRLLAAVPILALIAALPLVNRVQPLVFGLPFLLFWMLAWVMATPAFLGLAYVLVRRRDADGGTRETAGGRREAEGGGRRVDGGER